MSAGDSATRPSTSTDADIIAWFRKVQRYNEWQVPREKARAEVKGPLPKVLEPQDKDNTLNYLVVGPWRHSGVNYDGSSLGALKFTGDTALELPRGLGRRLVGRLVVQFLSPRRLARHARRGSCEQSADLVERTDAGTHVLQVHDAGLSGDG